MQHRMAQISPSRHGRPFGAGGEKQLRAWHGKLRRRPPKAILKTMDYLEFRRLRAGAMGNLPPASVATLDAAAARLRHRLNSSAMFAQIVVETTGDAERLLVAAVQYRPSTPVEQVCSHLEAIWVSELRLPGLDAFNFHTEGERIELESFTGDKASGYFLTLHLLATEESAEDYETRRSAEEAARTAAPTRRRWLRR